MATLYTSWYDEILPEVPGVLQALALNAIKQAVIEFFDRSWVWIGDQAAIPIVALTNEYAYTPAVDTEVARALKIWVNKLPLTPKTMGELSDFYGDYMVVEGAPEFFIQDRPDKLILVPKPTSVPTIGITGKVALKPTQAAAQIIAAGDVYANKHREAIAIGAKARLFRIPKKPWTDTSQASDLAAKFDAKIAEAKLDSARGLAGARHRGRTSFL